MSGISNDTQTQAGTDMPLTVLDGYIFMPCEMPSLMHP
jgi:hypothetical protein